MATTTTIARAMNTKLLEYIALKRDAKALAEQADEALAALKKYADDHGIDKWEHEFAHYSRQEARDTITVKSDKVKDFFAKNGLNLTEVQGVTHYKETAKVTVTKEGTKNGF